MPLADTLFGFEPAPRPVPASAERKAELAEHAYLASLEGVLVSQPVFHDFPGAIEEQIARSVWVWIGRDVARQEVARLGDAIDAGATPEMALAAVLPDIVQCLRANAQLEQVDPETRRRNAIQMGGENVQAALPKVIMALRKRHVLQQAEKFGAAFGALADEAALANALQTIPISNPLTRALWMQAMVGHMSNPSRLVAAVAAMAGGRGEDAVIGSGNGAVVEAVLSHAQSQIGRLVGRPSLFSDIDLSCKSIERFHRLMRAINYHLDIDRKSRWGKIVTDLTGRLSERLQRPLAEVNANVVQALRKPRDGADLVDADTVLEAYNGLYLLLVARASRDSLAVNALLEQAWSETGQTLESHVSRLLDTLRANPGDAVARERMEAGIKMAEIRFNTGYADILRRARDVALKRSVGS